MSDRTFPASGRPSPGTVRTPTIGGRLKTWFVDWSLALPLIALASLLLVAPAVSMILSSVTGEDGGFTLINWAKTFGSTGSQRAMQNSLLLAATVATVSTLVGTPLAWLISRMARWSRSFHLGMLNVAANFSGIGLGFAYVAALGTYGMVTLAVQNTGVVFTGLPQSSFAGLVLAYCYSNIPLFVLLSLPAMSLLRDEWWEAAQACAATRLQFWRHVGAPILMPFILADWLLIFTWSAGMYGLPVALVGEKPGAFRLVTVEMYRSLYGSFFGDHRMPVYAVLLMGLAALSLLANRFIMRRGTRWLT